MTAALEICMKNRQNLVNYCDKLSAKQLNHIPKGFNNNIIWNIAHTVSVQQGLVYGLSNLKFSVEKEFVKAYTRGTKPEGDVSEEDIQQLKGLLISTIEKTILDYEAGNFKEFRDFQVGLGNTLTSVEDAIAFNNYHEGLHLGYIMAQRKLV